MIIYVFYSYNHLIQVDNSLADNRPLRAIHPRVINLFEICKYVVLFIKRQQLVGYSIDYPAILASRMPFFKEP